MFAIRFALLISFLFGFTVINYEGTGIDPHGGPRLSADQGPAIDPNGRPTATSTGATTDAGPRMDPEG